MFFGKVSNIFHSFLSLLPTPLVLALSGLDRYDNFGRDNAGPGCGLHRERLCYSSQSSGPPPGPGGLGKVLVTAEDSRFHGSLSARRRPCTKECQLSPPEQLPAGQERSQPKPCPPALARGPEWGVSSALGGDRGTGP